MSQESASLPRARTRIATDRLPAAAGTQPTPCRSVLTPGAVASLCLLTRTASDAVEPRAWGPSSAARTNALAAAQLCCALLAFSHAGVALSASTSATLTVSVTVLPTKAQRLMAAQMSVRQPDGTVLVLNSQQQAQYIANPESLRKHVRGSPGEYVLVTVEY